jgi:hypothetical protein
LVGGFRDAPKKTYVQTLKRVFRYLKGTLDFGLWYPTCTKFILTSYIDADWEGSVDDKKSTKGGELFMGNIRVSWFNNKKS